MPSTGDIRLEANWPNDGTTWVDITADADSLSIQRGRQRSTGAVSPGTINNLTLDNTGGKYTPSNVGGVYYPNVKPNRDLRVAAYNGSAWVYLITAGIDGVTPSWDGSAARPVANVTGTDGFKGLQRRGSHAFYTETVLDNPNLPSLAYFSLSEPSDAVTFGSVAPSTAPPVAVLTNSKYGAGTFTAGNGQGFLGGAPAATYCTFGFTGTGNTEHMTVLQLGGVAGQTGVSLPAGGGWTWGCWFQVPTAPTDRATLLFARGFNNADPALSAAQRTAHLYVDSAGKVNFNVSAGGVTATATSSAVYSGAAWHYATASLGTDLKTLSLFVDSSSTTAVAASAFSSLGSLGWLTAGGALSPYGDSQYGLNGSLANLEFYSAVDTALLNGIRWLFGARMYYLSADSGSIIVNIAQNYGYTTLSTPLVLADTGVTSQIAQFEMDGLSYLDAMQQVTDTEQGLLYVRGDGALIFKNRAFLVNQASALTLNVAAGDVTPDFQVGSDDEQLFNDYAATRPGGAVVRVRDTTSTSIADNGVCTNAPTDASADLVLLTTDNEVRDFASFKVANHSQPQPRTPRLTIDLLRAASLWPSVLNLDIGVRITVTNLPAEAPASSMDYIVESMKWEFSGRSDTRTLTIDTSAADVQKYFTLDDNTYGLLDNNVLFY